jgi:hypothetical protein
LSWPPTPADHLKQAEMLALKTFGALLKDIRSPQHPYFACWRDQDPANFAATEHDKAPTAILFSAQFGVAPYETPVSLVEAAEMFNRLDRARLRLDLVRDQSGLFRVDGLEVEINDAESRKGRHFRSCWKGEEIEGLDLSVQFDAPATRADPFRFHIRARLPRRYNRGAPVEQEHVAFTVSGGAMPLPRWVNY